MTLLAALGLFGFAHAQSTPPASSAPKFITISNNAILSSHLIGLNIQSASGEGMAMSGIRKTVISHSCLEHHRTMSQET